ncbi:MAG: efflux RND transporter periplasmic adaptor subunit [Bacteroidales bacterium]|nr:efflux RND transporter periplasmic adaptor subunit [Bacteroidales bacterium]
MIKYISLLILVIIVACNTQNTIEVPVTKVKKGVFTEELTEEGVVQAVNSILVITPRISYRYGMLKLASIVEDGTEVEKGDTVLVFDPSEVKKAIINAEQQIEIAKAEYEKLKATQESEIEDLEADLEITGISQQISQINFDNAQFESEITKREINLQLQTANISLERAREQIDNKKKIHREELYQKKLAMNQLNTSLNDARKALDQLFVVSPSKGIVIVKDNWMSGQKWKVGEQPYPGMPIIDLPDLTKMMAEVKINEVDVSKVKLNLKVKIKSDVYSDTTYSGEITQVANLAQPKEYKSKIKVFPVRIMIDGNNKKLLPGLTVSCTILVNEIKNVLFIPIECVFEDLGNTYVYVQTKSGYRRQDVKTAAENSDFVVISEGLSEGVEIALADPYFNKQENTNGNGSSY